jgi:hypothetical protein
MLMAYLLRAPFLPTFTGVAGGAVMIGAPYVSYHFPIWSQTMPPDVKLLITMIGVLNMINPVVMLLNKASG